MPAGFSFCTACGNPLTDTQSHHAQPAEGTADRLTIGSVGEQAVREVPPGEAPSERRLVSVLFCDLENFTGLAESLDPEEVRDILSRYFEAARGIVARFGGTIEKFIGDAVVGVWGTPVAREDDAERAVRAALEIVVAVAACVVRPCRNRWQPGPPSQQGSQPSSSAWRTRGWWQATS